MENNKEVLLKVDHLCQYFGFNKAVDDVSFEVHKGEVFGLVGESGCGKTTTGRTIIRLYDPTSGSVYFKGQRVAAGTLSYKKAIKATEAEIKELKKRLAVADYDAIIDCKSNIKSEKNAIVALEAQAKGADPEAKDSIKEKIEAKKATIAGLNDKIKSLKKQSLSEANPIAADKISEEIAAKKAFIKEQKEEIKKAVHDHKHCDKDLITKIQMIFQDPIASLDPRMTVRDIIAEGLIINGMKDKKEIDEKVYKMLEMVGLVKEHASRYPHEFSGGQKQRIGVARAVIMEPELIIADEPVSALDVSIQAQVINLLNDLREELGLTILFVAHDLSVVKYFSDRIGVMYYGKLVELADADELFLNPLHPYTKSLLSAIPLPDPIYEKQRKRITYNPLASHDYSVEGPILREIKPGHFVYCNSAEFEQYSKELK